jgi:hypothetical protein
MPIRLKDGRPERGLVGMTDHRPKESTMNRMPLKSGLAAAALVVSLGLAAGAQARIPVEPGAGSPVTYHGNPTPAKQHGKKRTKSTKRQDGGFPVSSGTHVKSQAEARTE